MLVCVNLIVPTMGNFAGCVITSLPRGYWNTQPPSDSCSSVTNRMLRDFAVSEGYVKKADEATIDLEKYRAERKAREGSR